MTRSEFLTCLEMLIREDSVQRATIAQQEVALEAWRETAQSVGAVYPHALARYLKAMRPHPDAIAPPEAPWTRRIEDHASLSYEKHLEWLSCHAVEADAELTGFITAKTTDDPGRRYANDGLQSCYERGFAEGKLKLEQEHADDVQAG